MIVEPFVGQRLEGDRPQLGRLELHQLLGDAKTLRQHRGGRV